MRAAKNESEALTRVETLRTFHAGFHATLNLALNANRNDNMIMNEASGMNMSELLHDYVVHAKDL
jgi:hypothetical protein